MHLQPRKNLHHSSMNWLTREERREKLLCLIACILELQLQVLKNIYLWFVSKKLIIFLALDVVWMFNEKLLNPSKNVKVSFKDNKTTCTILSAERENEGTYACRAMSSIGQAITKATLICHGKMIIKYMESFKLPSVYFRSLWGGEK